MLHGNVESARMPEEFENVLQFWFPEQLRAPTTRRWPASSNGGFAAERTRRSLIGQLLPEQAAGGQRDHWSNSLRSRLALIIVLDQFSRSVYRGTARAYAQDPVSRVARRERTGATACSKLPGRLSTSLTIIATRRAPLSSLPVHAAPPAGATVGRFRTPVRRAGPRHLHTSARRSAGPPAGRRRCGRRARTPPAAGSD